MHCLATMLRYKLASKFKTFCVTTVLANSEVSHINNTRIRRNGAFRTLSRLQILSWTGPRHQLSFGSNAQFMLCICTTDFLCQVLMASHPSRKLLDSNQTFQLYFNSVFGSLCTITRKSHFLQDQLRNLGDGLELQKMLEMSSLTGF